MSKTNVTKSINNLEDLRYSQRYSEALQIEKGRKELTLGDSGSFPSDPVFLCSEDMLASNQVSRQTGISFNN